MGMSLKDKERFNIIDARAYQMYTNGKSPTAIAQELGIKRDSLIRRLRQKYNATILPDGRKTIREDYFTTIDSPSKAYWLGFLYADGTVSGTRNTIELCLGTKDREHLIKFTNAIQSTTKVSDKTIRRNGKEYLAARVAFRSTQMHSDLVSHGCTPNKSLTVSVPFQSVDTKLMKHFIRGYLDGDGSINLSRGSLYIGFHSGSTQLLYELKQFIMNVYGIEFCEPVKDKRSSLYSMPLYKQNDITALFNILYGESDESTRLTRKYNKYMRYMRGKR